MLTLNNLSYYICLILCCILLLAIYFNAKNIFGLFKKISRKYWLFLLIVFIIGLGLRIFFVPHRHYVFYDEYEHINIARNMLETKQFGSCDFYLDGKCLSFRFPRWVPGYHFLLSIIFGIFGVREAVAYNFNSVVSAATILVLFLTTYLITQNERVSLISALLLAFLPLHLKFAGNSSLETTSLFFILLSILSSLVFINLQNSYSLFLVFASVSFAAIVRPENIVLAVLLIPLFLMCKIKLTRFLGSFILPILFCPSLLYFRNIRETFSKNWISLRNDVGGFTLLLDNLFYWISNHSVPIVIVLSALGGFFCAIRKRNIFCIWLSFYFLAFVFMYTYIHKETMHIQDGHRFNLQFCFPVIILASLGLCEAYKMAYRYVRIKWLAPGILIFAVFLNYLICFPYTKQEISPWRFQDEYNYILNLKKSNIDPSCVFVTYETTSIITTLDRPAVDISHTFDKNLFDRYLKNRCLILFTDKWCIKDRDGFCSKFKKTFKFEKIE